MERAEDQFINERKKENKAKTIFLIFTIISLFVALYFIGELIDHKTDIKACKANFNVESYNTSAGYTCFANEDFNKINLGHNLNCDCFYIDNLRFLQQKEFKIK